MIDDLIPLDTDQADTSMPLRKYFSFDTVAKSVSQPTDSSLVIRSNSLERLVDVDIPPPKIENSGGDSERKRSIAIPEDLEGAALTRKATIDGSIFPKYEVEGKEATKNGAKKRKIENDSSGFFFFCVFSFIYLVDKDDSNSASTPLARRAAVDYTSSSNSGKADEVATF